MKVIRQGDEYDAGEVLQMVEHGRWPVLVTHVYVSRRLTVAQVYWPGEEPVFSTAVPGDAVEEITRRGWNRCTIALPQRRGSYRMYSLRLRPRTKSGGEHG